MYAWRGAKNEEFEARRLDFNTTQTKMEMGTKASPHGSIWLDDGSSEMGSNNRHTITRTAKIRTTEDTMDRRYTRILTDSARQCRERMPRRDKQRTPQRQQLLDGLGKKKGSMEQVGKRLHQKGKEKHADRANQPPTTKHHTAATSHQPTITRHYQLITIHYSPNTNTNTSIHH